VQLYSLDISHTRWLISVRQTRESISVRGRR